MNARVTAEDVRRLLAEILDSELPPFTDQTSAADVEGWDSLNNVRLLLALEDEFGLDFPVDEVEKLANVGQLVALSNRLGKA